MTALTGGLLVSKIGVSGATVVGNERNAYCMPNGEIMIHSDLIQRLGLSNDEIAAVMPLDTASRLCG